MLIKSLYLVVGDAAAAAAFSFNFQPLPDILDKESIATTHIAKDVWLFFGSAAFLVFLPNDRKRGVLLYQTCTLEIAIFSNSGLYICEHII